MQNSKECLEYLAKQLVSNKEAVRVESTQDNMGVLLELHVANGDMGRVIGKSGVTAKAIRVIIRAIGSMEKANVTIKIIEPEGSKFNKPEDQPAK